MYRTCHDVKSELLGIFMWCGIPIGTTIIYYGL